MLPLVLAKAPHGVPAISTTTTTRPNPMAAPMPTQLVLPNHPTEPVDPAWQARLVREAVAEQQAEERKEGQVALAHLLRDSWSRHGLMPYPWPHPVHPKAEYNVVAYHGTNDVIASFDPRATKRQLGVFFSETPELANHFAFGDYPYGHPYHRPGTEGFLPAILAYFDRGTGRTIQAAHDTLMGLQAKLTGSSLDPRSQEYQAAHTLHSEALRYLTSAAYTASSMLDGAGRQAKSPNITKVRLRLGKNYEVNLGGRFSWDGEVSVLTYARARGFDSVTFTGWHEARPEERFYSVFSPDNIRHDLARSGVPTLAAHPP